MKPEMIVYAVTLFRESQNCSNDKIFDQLVAANVGRLDAARLVDLLPLAYCRIMLADSAVRFMNQFHRKLTDGRLSPERALESEPLWREVLQFAEAERKQAVKSENLMALAARSPEFHAINELLERGSKLEDIALSAPVFQWPESGPAKS